MADINRVILSGVMGKEVEVKSVASGFQVGNFSVATTENYKKKDSDSWESKTEWHSVTVLGNLVKYVAENGGKGVQITLEGKLVTESWDDKDGKKVYKTKIVANVVSLPRKSKGGSEVSSTSNSNNNNDDLPF